ncbi:MAG TPA: hypothetical protein DCF99_11810 [Flavobacteriaceae bacterium]|nr:hypothetical protein [Flavobacteriaceae bacterium]
MANVKLEGTNPAPGKPEATTLSLENVNQVLSYVLSSEVSSENGKIHLEISPAHKHGFSIFKAVPTLSTDEFKTLDKNDNNAYLITVNDKSTSTKAYKILFQVIDGKVEAKFVENDIKDADFTVKAKVDALFTDDSKATLKNEVTEATINEATKLVEKITNAQTKEALTAELTKASDLLSKEIAELKKGIQKDGSLAVEGTFEEFKKAYTFQMKSIYLKDNVPTYFVDGHSQAKDLTIEHINKGIQATLNAKDSGTSLQDKNYVQINHKEKHGYTILTVDSSELIADDFNKLDADNNKTYNITVNKKTGESFTKTYKILLENTESGTLGKFILYPDQK